MHAKISTQSTQWNFAILGMFFGSFVLGAPPQQQKMEVPHKNFLPAQFSPSDFIDPFKRRLKGLPAFYDEAAESAQSAMLQQISGIGHTDFVQNSPQQAHWDPLDASIHSDEGLSKPTSLNYPET
ncbi:MAG: hypothetical protein EOO38_20025, partial [Cytophagaceae bacterium]